MSAESYDQLPYPQISEVHTHPRIISAAAKSLGFTSPVDVEKCHVLELGCATGVNIIAMACELPNSQFVGIDYSKEQVTFGNKIIEELGLDNITLEYASITDIDESFGSFDYILAHGVYSWVPGEVKKKIFSVSNELLSANGIAYISHNCYPNWHLTMVMRDMMKFHARLWDAPMEKVENAVKITELIADAMQTKPSIYSEMLNMVRKRYIGKDKSYIFHEFLEEINEPVLLHQFMENAAENNLQFIGDTRFLRLSLNNYPAQVTDILDAFAPTLIEKEQYIDFIYGMNFRRTMLCHKNVALTAADSVEQFKSISLRNQAVKVQTQTMPSGQQMNKYTSKLDDTMTLDHPVTIIAMQNIISSAPQPIAFSELVEKTLEAINDSKTAQMQSMDKNTIATTLARWLKLAHSNGFVEMTTFTPSISTTPGSHPKASRFARYQARSETTVTNLLHEAIQLDEFCRQLLTLLDGTTSKESLARKMSAVQPAAYPDSDMPAAIDKALNRLATQAFLQA